MGVAKVVVDIPTRQLSSAFDYAIPGELTERARVGCPVLVDFAGRPAVGWIVEIADESEYDRLKPVRDVVGESRFDTVSAQLALWIAEEYAAPVADAVRLLLPPGTAPKAVRVTDEDGTGRWTLKPPTTAPVDERLVERVEGSDYVAPANARLQRVILEALARGPVTTSELAAEFGAVSSALKRLEALGAVSVRERRRFRTPAPAARAAPRHERLSRGQEEALAACTRVCASGGTVLLDGVTGSGKTEVYLRAIEDVVAAGRSAVVLVPEISLTPQTVGRFRSRFGDLVAVLHSRLGTGERLDEWDRIGAGEARVVVGARSALFAPVRDLGIIIIDEEHESSYKQSSSPRYHARDVAGRLARLRSAGLVLGSATPAFETLRAVETGEIEAVCLPERVSGGSLPDIEIVDMAFEFNSGERSMFSRALRARLDKVASGGTKAVLLLNRRGFANFLLCRECSYVPTCDSCSTSMTYHESGNFLACHHCGARRPVPATCPRCGSVYLRQFGAGTQRVVKELEQLVPGLPVVRMDADTTSGKGGHERRLAEFEGLSSGVLVGTQMVAKGLDYPEVTLVGVLNADTTLHLPDFRSAERTWQLLSQVAGRAGRGPLGGEVVIQTYWPDHPAVRAAATGDRSSLLAEEWAVRRQLGYPPFGRLANVVISGPSERDVAQVARDFAHELSTRLPEETHVLGPSPAPLAKVKRAFRYHLLVKSQSGDAVAPALREAAIALKRPPSVSVALDIDPYDLL